MQNKLLFRLALALLPLVAAGQSSYIRAGDPDYRLIDRLEIKSRSPILTQSFTRPYARRPLFAVVDSLRKDSSISLSGFDLRMAGQFLDDPEWDGEPGTVYKKETHTVIKSKGNNGNYWVFQGITRLDFSKEQGNSSNPFISSAGIDIRGTVFKKLGFSLYGTSNNERLPAYLGHWRSRFNSVPGAGRYNVKTKGRVDYADIRATIQAPVTKYIDLQLGYDRHFLGNGHRSLFLSDQAPSSIFFRINARIWKLNLQSLYIKLRPQDGIVNKAGTEKYLRINTLGIDLAKWLNIAFFDAVVMGRDNGFDLNYIMPITFLRAMEQQSGSPDNALLGMNIKANVAGKFQFYAQILADEFKLSEIKAGSGWWANKFGYQLGGKYIDAFGVANLDLQLEANRVRPFTYTHFDSVSNYSHYNQPLAHPLGANFNELIGIARFQPIRRLYLEAKLVHYKQGLDSSGFNTGNNILRSYNARPRDHGWEVGSGDKATCTIFSGLVSLEAVEDFFIDIAIMRRNFKSGQLGLNNTTMVSAGVRWNIARREFDY
jgi:hypothetical protein